MRIFTKKSTIQKIILALIVLLLINFTITPYASYAKDDEWGFAGSLAKELFNLLSWIGDVVMGALNKVMLGASTGFGGMGSAMLDADDPNLTNSESWLYAAPEEEVDVDLEAGSIDNSFFHIGDKNYQIPNMLYSPENIFSNNIAALDVNFLRENTYSSVFESGSAEFEENANKASISSASKLKETIANWYKSFRNIAIVGLLSVLIYLGIRILISSTAADKAKYKESITNWVVALCLVFMIHFIMSGILMITDKCTELFSTSTNEGIVVKVGDEVKFKTNLMGLIRFRAQSKSATETGAYTIMYLALVIYTCIFTVMYFKRFLYMAFFTMIAPLVALTYPIDKAGDGKAQAFNIWFKEYTMNAIIQPVHLILYTVFVSSAYELAIDNPIYALVAIAFLIPAEKFIKKMFKLDQAESTSGFGSFAGGALAMSALKRLGNGGPAGKGNKSKGGKDGDDSDAQSKAFRINNDNNRLDGFNGGIIPEDSNSPKRTRRLQ